MSNPAPALKEAPRIKVRLVWRLVLGLLLHFALLLVLAIYLVLSLNSVRSYAPIAAASEIQLESLNILPALLKAMNAEWRSYQKTADPADLALYKETRQQAEDNLSSLDTPLLLVSDNENERRAVVRQWIENVGDPGIAHVPLPPYETDRLTREGTRLLDRLGILSSQVRTEVQDNLARLQANEAGEAASRVTLMWIGVGTVTVITILLQLYLSNSIIAPIQALTSAVRRLQSGDYTARARIDSGDEIQSLGDTFNVMAENILRNQRELEEKNARLSEQQEALRHANVGLEGRVAEKTRELEDKNQKLHEAARLKDEFLATLSHELRTPLTPVISCAHLLGTDPALDAAQLKNVTVIDRNARALSRMIDELLDLSSVMNRKLRLTRERVELNEWARGTLEAMRPAWEKKGLTVSFVPAADPIELEIDPTRLAQVLTNLINNAIKFSEPQGRIIVRLIVSGDRVRLGVTDYGAGLDRQDLDKIFEMFYQSRTRQTEGVGGLGVGLTVARSLAELHGGGLYAESPGRGKGATFTLWLPCIASVPSSDSVVPPPPAIDRTLLRGRTLFLVEDSTDTREALQRIYQRRECKVTAVSSAEEALEKFTGAPPDILISDIGLPGLSGLELMARLRALPGWENVTAVALSGLGREQDVTATAKAGFDQHLLKPVDLNVLDQILIEALRKKSEG